MQISDPIGPLDADQIYSFVRNGFVRLDQAFPSELAAAARAALSHQAVPSGSVARIAWHADPVFREIAAQSRLAGAFDQLVGAGRWAAFRAVSSFVIRFPSAGDPGDTGWHVDMSFDTEATDFFDWRINVTSRGRALLMLFLLSDVGPDDAPTRLRVGSHRDVARRLAPAGDGGITLRALAADDFGSAHRPLISATGRAGTVYLCHPFLVHAAQRHRGIAPRMLAQPPLLPAVPLNPWRAGAAPVERAIREALV